MMSRLPFSRLSESKIDSLSKPGIKNMYTLKTALLLSYLEIERLTALVLGSIVLFVLQFFV